MLIASLNNSGSFSAKSGLAPSTLTKGLIETARFVSKTPQGAAVLSKVFPEDSMSLLVSNTRAEVLLQAIRNKNKVKFDTCISGSI